MSGFLGSSMQFRFFRNRKDRDLKIHLFEYSNKSLLVREVPTEFIPLKSGARTVLDSARTTGFEFSILVRKIHLADHVIEIALPVVAIVRIGAARGRELRKIKPEHRRIIKRRIHQPFEMTFEKWQ